MVEEEKELTEDQEEQSPVGFLDEKPKNVFHYKNYTLAFLGALVSNLGNLLYSFAVSFYILSLTGNNAFIQGAYLATGGIVYVLVTLFGGVISDRFHKGKIMFMCDYIKGGVIIGFTLLLMLVIQDANAKVTILFVIAVISNIIAAVFSPAAASLMPHILPEKAIQQGQSYYTMMDSGLSILGVILAGILYAVLPINVLFLIVGGCYVLSGFSEMFINYNYQKKEGKLTVRTVFSDIGDGFKYLITIKPLLYLMICVLFVNFFFSPINSNFFPYFVVTDVSNNDYLFSNVLEPEMWQSIISVAVGLGMIIMALIFSMKKQKDKISKGLRISFALLIVISLVFTISYILFKNDVFGINPLLIIFVVTMFGLGLLLVTINVPTSTKTMTIVEKDKLGKVSSLINIGSQGLIPLSTFLAGIALQSLGASWLLCICAAGLMLISIVIMISRQISKL